MPARWRKFVGIFLLIGVIVVYALLVMVFAGAILPGAGPWTQLIFYAVAGLLWVPPTGWLIGWMHRGG
jgi:hypothetical protein